MKVQRTFSPHTGIFNDDDDRDTSHASKPKTVVITGKDLKISGYLWTLSHSDNYSVWI